MIELAIGYRRPRWEYQQHGSQTSDADALSDVRFRGKADMTLVSQNVRSALTFGSPNIQAELSESEVVPRGALKRSALRVAEMYGTLGRPSMSAF